MNKPIPITPENRDSIKFPCWLWAPPSTGYKGALVPALWYKVMSREEFEWDSTRPPSPTHYLPDQLEAPACVPEEELG